MHIPDNYLSPSTCLTIGAVMIPIWKRAVVVVKSEVSRRKLPLLGICSAFSFLIMLFNIPIPGGTTGHAIGATFIAILLGPNAAVISVTVALVIQALFFGDGGILALGVNTFNMAFIMPFTGYYIFKLIKGNSESEKRGYIASFIGAYVGMNIGVLLTAIEFGIQPILFKNAAGLPIYSPYSLQVSVPAMLIPHILIIGVLEGIITSGAYMYIRKLSPDIIYNSKLEKRKLSMKYMNILILVMMVLSPLGIIASGSAWGEWSNEELLGLIGYIPEGMKDGFIYNALFADYGVKGLSQNAGYLISTVIGVGIIFIVINIMGKLTIAKNNN